MTDKEIDALLAQYERRRPRYGNSTVITESSLSARVSRSRKRRLLRLLIHHLSSVGFSGWSYDGDAEFYRSFITCYYGVVRCRLDVSRAEFSLEWLMHLSGSGGGCWGITLGRWGIICGSADKGRLVEIVKLRLDKLMVP